jgi:glycosyltransferase involved in cell wall biosynthesis
MSNRKTDKITKTKFQVSVIVPVYNAERFVTQAVESALAQAETGEVVLVEDGSSDNSLALCEELARRESRVRLVRHQKGKNRGPAASRNLGIQTTRFPYIAFLDADDYYLPRRFERAKTLMEDNETVDGIYDAVGVTFESTEAETWWNTYRSDGPLTTITAVVAPEELFEALLRYRYGAFCTDGITVRRDLFERAGFFAVHLRMCQDSCMWWKMAIVGRLQGGVLDSAVAVRRVHGENRIIQNRDVHGFYEYLARRELMRWLPRDYRTPERVKLIRTSLINTWRENVRNSYPRWQRHFRYVGFLGGLLLESPSIARHSYYRHCVKEATGLLGLRELIKR